MFKLSQKADYGLILLSSLQSSSNESLSISKIAKRHKISAKFLSLIAQELKKTGVLTAKEGVSGGYSLAKKPEEIKLVEVLKILEGDLASGKCFKQGHKCRCGAKDIWIEMCRQMEKSISKKTVADLVKGG